MLIAATLNFMQIMDVLETLKAPVQEIHTNDSY